MTEGGTVKTGDDESVDLPITGELDLHGFRPGDVGELVPEYLRLCRERGILEVRVVHGRGIGALARSVHAILARSPEVEAFGLATSEYGGAGATMVRLSRDSAADSPKDAKTRQA